MLQKIQDGVRKVVAGFKKALSAIARIIKFLSTTVGFVVGIIVLVVILVFIISVLIESVFKAYAKYFDPEFAGISSENDYKEIVSAIGNAGYDSYITEAVWQEYAAYEYAVLMDVAEYWYEGQKEFNFGNTTNTESYDEVDEAYGYANPGVTSQNNGYKIQKIKNPKYLPYLPVKADYDVRLISNADWKKAVLTGQNSARFGCSADELPSLAGTSHVELGGNREVMMPVLTYEFKNNPNEPDAAGSLVPYITTVKDSLVYNYYTVGGEGPNGARNHYESAEKDENSGGADIGGMAGTRFGDINIMEVNELLNKNNKWLPNSLSAVKNLGLSSSNMTAGNRATAGEPFAPSLYHTDQAGSAVYRIPLQTLIDRYLPKASVLTAWFSLKESDTTMDVEGNKIEKSDELDVFQVAELMEDIKNIYNEWCYSGETIKTESAEVVKYNKVDGQIERDENGEAEKEEVEDLIYSETNKKTFLKFGQVGLETNRFSVWDYYDPKKVQGGPQCEDYANVTYAEDEATVPVVVDLIAEDAAMLKEVEVEMKFTYNYQVKETSWAKREARVPLDTEYISTSGVNITAAKSTNPPYDFKNDALNKLRDGNSSYRFISGNGPKKDTINGIWRIPYEVKTTTYVTKKATDTLTGIYFQDMVTNPSGMRSGDPATTFDDAVYAAIVRGENSFMSDPNNQKDFGKAYIQEAKTEWLINYEYIWGLGTEVKDGKISAELLSDVRDYDQPFAIYNFKVGGLPAKQSLTDDIIGKIVELPGTDQQVLIDYIQLIADTGGLRDLLQVQNNPDLNNPTFRLMEDADPASKSIVSVNSIENVRAGYEALFDPVTDTDVNDGKAAYIIDEQTIALTMNVPQKRLSAVLITEAHTWAKDAKYDINITQNTFIPSNFRFVIPHSFCNFGVTDFTVNEVATFRTGYYNKYFSKVLDKYGKVVRDPAIKEEDVITMLMSWERYGKEGEESAYVFMRDLYKLIMYIRDDGGILETAYNYMYIPEHIWDFREGITQEAFWTERLASEISGPDALTQEEQKKLLVTKTELAWQIVDYDSYEECEFNNGTETTQAMYALFPHGNEFVRTRMMEFALATSEFDDGGFKVGHAGSDWSARSFTSDILNYGTGKLKVPKGDTTDPKIAQANISRLIYNFELKRRVLVELAKSGVNKLDEYNPVSIEAEDFPAGMVSDESVLSRVQVQLNKDLEEYKVRTPIVAVAPGLVTKARYNCYGGFVAGVKHNSPSGDSEIDVETSYVHMRRWPNVQTGDIVGAGTILGYEGTTGNSGGPHLHMGLRIKETSECPAKYMALVFTPFYNVEKINQAIEDNKRTGNHFETVLASEYFSLVRTSLITRFNEDGDILGLDGLDSQENTHVYTDGDGAFVVSIALSGDVTYGEDDGVERYIKITKNELIQKWRESPSNHVYVYNEVKNNGLAVGEKKYTKYSSAFFTEGKAYGTGEFCLYLSISDPVEEIISGDYISGQIKIKTHLQGRTPKYANQKMKYGNNVPLTPLLESADDGYSMTVVSLTKYFPRKDTRKNFSSLQYDDSDSGDSQKYSGEQVRARKDTFDIESEYVAERLEVPAYLLATYAAPESQFAIQFYDGPMNKAMNDIEFEVGLPYSQSGDLKLFQEALNAKGFKAGGALKANGEFDDATVEALKEAAKKIREANNGSGSFLNKLEVGEIGDGEINKGEKFLTYILEGSIDNVILFSPGADKVAKQSEKEKTVHHTGTQVAVLKYGIDSICAAWNPYVSYGSLKNARDAGKMAIAQAAVQHGLDANFIAAVSFCEGDFIPSRESNNLGGTLYETNFTGTPHEIDLDPDNNIITYKGAQRAVRRAQGMMQVMHYEAYDYCANMGVTDTDMIVQIWRSAYGNAMIASNILRRNIITVETEYRDWANSVLSSNPEWKRLESETGIQARSLLEYACSALMYNKGGGYFGRSDENCREILAEMTYSTTVNNGKKEYTFKSNSGHSSKMPGYTDKLLKYICEH